MLVSFDFSAYNKHMENNTANPIKWNRKALKQLGKLHSADQATVKNAVRALAHMPNVHNVKALVKHVYGYRLRVGNYRVLFDWNGDIRIVKIQEVKKRDERTY